MRRFMRFDHLGNPIGEVSPNDIMEMTRKEEINGEHSLELTTFQVLNKNERIVYQDGRGYWREYVVVGVDEEHAARNRIVGTYYCVWSVMPDLMGVPVSVMPGVQNPVSAGVALQSLLSAQARWRSGTVTQTATGGASMYDMDAWKALGVLVENWGGELSATIEVGTQAGVTARKVDLYNQLGTSTATRRFDFGADLKSVKRRFADAPMYCRISPRGAGEQSGDGYGRKIRITDVNGGRDYLEYAPMVDVCKLPSGSDYIYPTAIIENSNCKTPAELLAWAQGQLVDACTPKVTYEVDVIQAGVEGVDLTGVSLGDTVHIVDRYFGDEGLRLSGRIVSMTVDELDEREITVKVGNIDDSLTDTFGRLTSQLSTVSTVVQNINGGTMSTADYLSNLIDRLNTEINATGGYWYMIPGQGTRTYDVAVSDPAVGAEASSVVEIKGGTIRIANSRTSGGDWEWKTVFTSGHIASELVTTAQLTAGTITSSNGASYWNLDTSEMLLSGSVTLEKTMSSTQNGSASLIQGKIYQIQQTSAVDSVGFVSKATVKKTSVNHTRGIYIFANPYGLSKDSSVIFADNPIELQSQLHISDSYTISGGMNPSGTCGRVHIGSQWFRYYADSRLQSLDGSSEVAMFAHSSGVPFSINSGNGLRVNHYRIYVAGDFVATGTKNRLVETEHYGGRLLYCYETPSPMFGDIGSGTIDEDGVCYVMVDDIFAEAARTDFAYQVFLQKCGQGDLWVDEKTPTYFVVRGTPGLPFDWELKAKQAGYVNERFEDESINDDFDTALRDDGLGIKSIDDMYEDDYYYPQIIEGELVKEEEDNNEAA